MDNETFLKKTGAKIRILRTNKKLSQYNLAEKANLDSNYISIIERGETNPTLTYLLQLANALDVDIREFFDFTI